MCSQSNQQYACSSSNSCVGVQLRGSCLHTYDREEQQLQLTHYDNGRCFMSTRFLCMLMNHRADKQASAVKVNHLMSVPICVIWRP
jgi:hypothetical protein